MIDDNIDLRYVSFSWCKTESMWNEIETNYFENSEFYFELLIGELADSKLTQKGAIWLLKATINAIRINR